MQSRFPLPASVKHSITRLVHLHVWLSRLCSSAHKPCFVFFVAPDKPPIKESNKFKFGVITLKKNNIFFPELHRSIQINYCIFKSAFYVLLGQSGVQWGFWTWRSCLYIVLLTVCTEMFFLFSSVCLVSLWQYVNVFISCSDWNILFSLMNLGFLFLASDGSYYGTIHCKLINDVASCVSRTF